MTNRQLLVSETLRIIARERENGFAECGPMAYQLMHDYRREGNPAELLWGDLPTHRVVEDVADLLGLWCWYGDDNGSSILRTAEEWITDCCDEERVAVALNLDAYPFLDAQEMQSKLGKVALNFPSLQEKCRQLIGERGEE